MRRATPTLASACLSPEPLDCASTGAPTHKRRARRPRARARVHSRIVFDTAGCGAEFDELGRGSPEPPEVSDEPRTPSNIDVMGGGDDTEDRAVELSQVSADVGSPDTSRGYGPGGILDLSA